MNQDMNVHRRDLNTQIYLHLVHSIYFMLQLSFAKSIFIFRFDGNFLQKLCLHSENRAVELVCNKWTISILLLRLYCLTGLLFFFFFVCVNVCVYEYYFYIVAVQLHRMVYPLIRFCLIYLFSPNFITHPPGKSFIHTFEIFQTNESNTTKIRQIYYM